MVDRLAAATEPWQKEILQECQQMLQELNERDRMRDTDLVKARLGFIGIGTA